MPAGDWPNESIDKLKKLWDAGLSATEIMAEIPGYSRSAILGKASRLKLAPRRIDNGRHPVGDPKPAPIPRKRGSAETRFNPTFSNSPMPRRNQSNDIVEKLKIAAAEPGLSKKLEEPSDGKGVKLVDLENHHCRWPKGDPRDASFMFCGEAADVAAGQPYCPFHKLKSVDRAAIRSPKAFEKDALYHAGRRR